MKVWDTCFHEMGTTFLSIVNVGIEHLPVYFIWLGHTETYLVLKPKKLPIGSTYLTKSSFGFGRELTGSRRRRLRRKLKHCLSLLALRKKHIHVLYRTYRPAIYLFVCGGELASTSVKTASPNAPVRRW